MSKKFITYLTIAALLSAVVMNSGGTALAATTTNSINSSINSIQNEVNNLANIRNSTSISNSAKTAEEVAAQKKVLQGVIALSKNEINAAQEKLNNLPTFDKDSAGYVLQNNYLTELGAYSKYFAEESSIVANATTSSQLQAVATDIKNFRNSGYNSEIYDMITFTLLYYDASIISTAGSRLSSIKSDLSSLESSQLLANQSALDDEVSQAADLINTASTLHDQASDLILQTSSSTESASTTSSLNASSTATTTKAAANPDPRSILEKSINDIKSAYQIFIKVANSIKDQLDL